LVEHRDECLHGWVGVALTRQQALDWAAPERTLFNDGLGWRIQPVDATAS